MKRLGIIIIGAGGYWAPNIIRNALKSPGVELLYLVDNDGEKLKKLKVPGAKLITDYKKALSDPKVDAVLIVTPVSSHHRIAKDVITAKKHCYVQKPMVETVAQAEELTTLSWENGVKLMTAFTFVYHECIRKITELAPEIGNKYFYDSTRINLGIIQRDVNILWDLFCHDAAILYYLTNELPEYISATGQSHNKNKLIDVANVSLMYKNGFGAHCHSNWISPIKNRTIILAGEKKMVVFDDCSNEKLKIYDSGFSPKGDVFDYRTGDILIPKISNTEAVYCEMEHFFNSIRNDWNPITDGKFSIAVLKMIEAADLSVKNNGAPVKL